MLGDTAEEEVEIPSHCTSSGKQQPSPVRVLSVSWPPRQVAPARSPPRSCCCEQGSRSHHRYSHRQQAGLDCTAQGGRLSLCWPGPYVLGLPLNSQLAGRRAAWLIVGLEVPVCLVGTGTYHWVIGADTLVLQEAIAAVVIVGKRLASPIHLAEVHTCLQGEESVGVGANGVSFILHDTLFCNVHVFLRVLVENPNLETERPNGGDSPMA
mmetsp:Transcript_71077/g.179401  ORF Transcript_71077/g.179401 Transcript_71077/m.179401 type:complete len:210 (-) Transcript_71077:985-1614(-)